MRFLGYGQCFRHCLLMHTLPLYRTSSFISVERPQLIAWRKALIWQMTWSFIVEVNHFRETCLKFKHEMERVVATCKKVYNIHKEMKQSKITSLQTLCRLPLHHALYIIQLPWQLSPTNTGLIPVNTNSNKFMFINH